MTSQVLTRVVLLCPCIALASHVLAQTAPVTIQVLNGHNGKPVAHRSVSVRIEPLVLDNIRYLPTTDANGVLTVQAPLQAGINAIVTEFPTCRHVPKADRTKGPITFPVHQVLSSGVVEANNCSHRTVPPTPGQLTLFVRPLHWWERLSD